MERTLICCDMCGKPEAHKFSFAVDRERDAAGDSDTIYQRVDLCGECTASQLEMFIYALPWTARKKFTQDVMNDKRFYLSHMSRE